MECYCYILECSDGTYYTGWTTDPARREKQHNQGRGARYTSTRRPVRLVYVEPQPDRANAMRRERKLKMLRREQKQKLIILHPLDRPASQKIADALVVEEKQSFHSEI